jgi:hypothetical protein
MAKQGLLTKEEIRQGLKDLLAMGLLEEIKPGVYRFTAAGSALYEVWPTLTNEPKPLPPWKARK